MRPELGAEFSGRRLVGGETDEFRGGEPCGPEHLQISLRCGCVRDTIGPKVASRCAVRIDPSHVCELKTAAGLQNPKRLLEYSRVMHRKVDGVIKNDRIGAGIRETCCLDSGDPAAALGKKSPGLLG